jgi:diguanylate cyclase (GGDEF)-like protein
MSRQTEPTHVMVYVEDESRAAIFRSMLGHTPGLLTELAYTVSHLQRYASAAPVDVILLDLVDTDLLRIEQLVTELRATNSPTAHIPLTGLFSEGSNLELRPLALSYGLAEIFVEPLDDIQLLTRLIMLARIKQAEDQIRQLAITDPLTGLFDHRYFFLRLGEELSRARRYSRPLCCVMCSLDDLDNSEEAIEHDLRNKLLIQLAVMLQAEKRDIDVLARTAGNTFSLLLYNTDVPGAVVLIERVRRMLNQLDPNEQGETLRLSCGLAAAKGNDEPNMHPEEFRQRTELALRQAQAQGGGCTVIYTPEMTRQILEA